MRTETTKKLLGRGSGRDNIEQGIELNNRLRVGYSRVLERHFFAPLGVTKIREGYCSQEDVLTGRWWLALTSFFFF